MYKIKKQIAPEYLVELFSVRESHYNIRNQDQFNLPNFNTITYGRKSFSYYGTKLWTNIPNAIKECVSLSSLKVALSVWLDSIEDVNLIDFL